ncbi:MAG: DNA (cytosine-5-)-methyltransferase [Methylocystis sp.]|jgi:site-specific DNA-cytosine methylase
MREFYEFFSGGGMARIGLGADWRCAFANDFDAKKGAIYRTNFGAGHLMVADVAKLTTDDVPGRADLVWASPPCQDISLAGNGAGLDGARSGAFFPWWALMRKMVSEGRAPRLIVIENVAALMTSSKGADFVAVARAIAEAGYVFGALVIGAALFIPQSRERVFIVAVRAEASLPRGLTRDSPTAPFHTMALQRGRRQPSADPAGALALVAPSDAARPQYDAAQCRGFRGALRRRRRDAAAARIDGALAPRQGRGRAGGRREGRRRHLSSHARQGAAGGNPLRWSRPCAEDAGRRLQHSKILADRWRRRNAVAQADAARMREIDGSA